MLRSILRRVSPDRGRTEKEEAEMAFDKSQDQPSQQQQSKQQEEVVEFKSQSPEIPQDVEFEAAPQLEEKIEENLENQER
jgi:hypothetical protein